MAFSGYGTVHEVLAAIGPADPNGGGDGHVTHAKHGSRARIRRWAVLGGEAPTQARQGVTFSKDLIRRATAEIHLLLEAGYEGVMFDVEAVKGGAQEVRELTWYTTPRCDPPPHTHTHSQNSPRPARNAMPRC